MSAGAARQARATPLYAVPEALEERPWRVALVVPPEIPRWLREFCELARRQAWIELVLLSAPAREHDAIPDAGPDLRLAIAWERCLHRAASAILAPEPLLPELEEEAAQAPTLDTVHARLGELRPDLVLLAAGPRSWASALAAQAAAGCWRLDDGLTHPHHAGLSLLGPVLRGEAATPVELVLQSPAGAPVRLAASYGRTRAASFLLTRSDAFRKLPPLLLRALRRVAAGQAPVVPGPAATLRLRPSPVPTAAPGAGLRLLLATLGASRRSLARRLRYREWALLVRHEDEPLDPDAPVLGAHSVLKAPKGWWADPCVVSAWGRKLLFVEEMDLATNQASIACVELASDGACRLGTALKEPGHLSFPQVFRWDGDWYLTVESGYDRRASLYRSTGFPLQWERVADLLTGWACVDPVLHHHEGRWYLFVNVAENDNSTSEDLFLFVADRLEGPYRAHPASPIVCDVRRARMAGRIFSHRGRLIRPSQDCGPNYGSAVVFNEILELGPETYRERVLSRLDPVEETKALEGCHSYSVEDGVEVLDMLGDPTAGSALLRVFADRRSAATRRRGRHPSTGPGAPAEAMAE